MRSAFIAATTVLLFHSIAAAWETDGLRLRARLQARWGVEDQRGHESWSDLILLRRARVDGRWRPNEWLRLVAELDLAEGPEAKDIYGRVEIHPLAHITVGQFKKVDD